MSCERNCEIYEYAPLDKAERRQTRLLCLAAGRNTERISGTLRTVSIDSEKCPPFTALSYTWGSMGTNAVICVDAKPFHVTINLLAALRHLRGEHEDRWVWVDAICINQADDAEKNLQVPNMHTIYRNAQSCLAWLWPPVKNAELAMSSIARLKNMWDLEDRDFGRPEWQAAIELLAHEFWRRLWILQELVFATAVNVSCGGIDVPLSQFFALKDNLARLERREHPTGGHTLYLVQRQKAARSSSIVMELGTRPSVNSEDRPAYPLLNLLTLKTGMRATDPRDHIFALLSLLPQSEWPLAPDYSLDVREVFTMVTLKVITTMRSLECLRLCTLRLMAVPSPHQWNVKTCKAYKVRVEDLECVILPTWVPNWTRSTPRPSQTRFGIHAGSADSIFSCDAGLRGRITALVYYQIPVLVTNAIVWDIIKSCCTLRWLEGQYDLEAVEKLVEETLGKSYVFATYHGEKCSLEEAFWRTLALDCNASDTCWRATWGDIDDFACRIDRGSHLSGREDRDLRQRNFFITESGMLGVGPDCSNVGDTVTILPSCSVPMILRRYLDYDLFTVVGESCMLHLPKYAVQQVIADSTTDVHGIMDGEVETALDGGKCEIGVINIV